MKTDRCSPRGGACGGQGGLLLIECLVYVALWLVIVGLGFSLFYRTMSSARRVARGADDAVQALRAGERWRAEVREATGMLQTVEIPGFAFPALVIPHAAGEIQYAFQGTNLLRRSGSADAPWKEALARVEASQMLRETNAAVVSWRWELELRSSDSPSKMKPLFTFLAVEGGKAKP